MVGITHHPAAMSAGSPRRMEQEKKKKEEHEDNREEKKRQDIQRGKHHCSRTDRTESIMSLRVFNCSSDLYDCLSLTIVVHGIVRCSKYVILA